MAKQSGLGDRLLIAAHDLSGDIGSIGNIAGPQEPLPVTGIDKSAFERTGGLRDGQIEYSAYFNPETAADAPPNTVDRAHAVLSALPTADQLVTYCRGYGLGRPAACLVSKQMNYDPTRGDDGSLTFAISAQANGFGLEWGEQLTPGLRTDTAATSGASVDFGTGDLDFGLQAYLHVLALEGTDCTITLEQSADDGAADPFAAVVGGAFTTVTAAPHAERIQTARGQTVERYLRVATSGTFTSITFLVAVMVNPVEVTF